MGCDTKVSSVDSCCLFWRNIVLPYLGQKSDARSSVCTKLLPIYITAWWHSIQVQWPLKSEDANISITAHVITVCNP